MYDLPSEDPEEPGVLDEFHTFQPQLLRETCQPLTYPAEEIFIGTDINLYYDSRHALWHKRLDWFVALGVARAEEQRDLRWSYVIWQEGVIPYLVIELLSPGTELDDLGQTLREVNQPPTKWQVYEQVLRIPYYGTFDCYTNQFRLFRLVATRYETVDLPEQTFWFTEMELGLGVWEGCYQGIQGRWLRWHDAQDRWLPTADERQQQERHQVEQERLRAEQEARRAEQEALRAEKFAARLRELGIDPNDIE